MKRKFSVSKHAKNAIHVMGIFALALLVLMSSCSFTIEKTFVIDTGGKLNGFYTYYIPETGELGSITEGKIVFSGVNEVILGGMPEYGAPIKDHPVTPERALKVYLKKNEYVKPEQLTFAVLIASPKRKIILMNAPVSSPWHYPAGISYLTSYLRNKGHTVDMRYGHIIGLEYLLKKQNQEQAEIAFAITRNSRNSVLDWYKARKIFEQISGSIVTNDRFSMSRNNVTYVGQYQDGSIKGALKTLEYKENNLWYEYFQRIEIPIILNEKPNIYGISIADERQLIPGLVLASMVKKASPQSLVVLGGNLWSRMMNTYHDIEFYELFKQCCDVIVYREGFIPLADLADGFSPQNISGVVWNNGKHLIVNQSPQRPVSFERLPTPVFDGGAQQLSLDNVYPLYSASNCFMQCEFCSISSGSDTFLGKPRVSSAKKIVEHMIITGGKRFDFYDEMLPVATQLKIGEELQARNYYAEWYCYSTADVRFLSQDFCNKLYEAGCRGVQIGLESLNTETLIDENKKWNKPENYARILSNLKNAGIQTHVFIIVGLPGEPLHQTLKWLGFLDTYGDSILTIKVGRYRVAKNAPDEDNPNPNYIQVLKDTKPLHLNRDFRYLETSNKKIDALRTLLEQACREHWAYGVTSAIPWWANRGRYSWDELKQMKASLPKDEPVEHLNKAMAKASTIIQEELGKRISFASFGGLVEFTKTI